MSSPNQKNRMQASPSLPSAEARAESVEEMARAIYLRLVTRNGSDLKTTAFWAEQSIADAETFHAILGRWRAEINRTQPEPATAGT